MTWLNTVLAQRRGLDDPGTPPDWGALWEAVATGWPPAPEVVATVAWYAAVLLAGGWLLAQLDHRLTRHLEE